LKAAFEKTAFQVPEELNGAAAAAVRPSGFVFYAPINWDAKVVLVSQQKPEKVQEIGQLC